MGREIKFRGMTEDEEWIYGSLIDGNRIVGKVVEWDSDYFCTEFWQTVDRKTVGQYTGLKDRNGKEIYEGDIGYVLIDRYSDPETPFLSVVECDRCFWSFRHLERGDLHEIWPKDKFEIIGNIYENPELLEAK